MLAVLLIVLSQSLTLRLWAQEDDVAALEEQAMTAAVERVAASVVRIETVGGLDRVSNVLLGDGPTTGLVVGADGFVISSAFNFIRKPSSILVTLPSGDRASAEIVARDHSRMLVLLKVNSDEELAVPEAVPLDQMQVGQWAVAVGRVFDPKRPNMSVGIVSARDRIWGKAIQTDAKISPSNYGGPLIDIRGRVLGVLVPMSPNHQTEVAGAEWYDSGIGFAVPLADLDAQIERMKKGEDVHPGLLGIALKGGDIYSTPAEIAACQVKSPAHEAGLRAGDVIVAIDDLKIQRQAQLKHALGPRYAGDTVHVVVTRGEDRVEADVTLADKLIPYEHSFLGILPRRDNAGVVVRHVFPASGADEAGIRPGDQIVSIDTKEVADAGSLRVAVANFEPNQTVAVEFKRDGETQQAELKLGSLPTTIPESLPPSRDRQPAEEADEEPAFSEIKIAEEPNECLAFVPASYDADVPHGVVVYLRVPGDFDRDKLLARWREHCEAKDLILLAPQPQDKNRWTPTEVEFVRKTLDHVVTNYNVDKSRIALYGRQAGGALSYLFAFRNREITRAVIAIDAAMPVRVRLPANDPVYRLAVLTTLAKQSPVADRVEKAIEMLREARYPVTVMELGEARELSADELQQVVRWIDTLDRI
jgi:serine protease Do